MATSQTAADKKKVGMLGERDAGGFVYTSIGAIDFYTGEGEPDHEARPGSIYIDVENSGIAYIYAYDTNSVQWDWVVIGSQS
jgi:hypothetical protein|tara:strand:- start:239 stop:484 length:246 start_codon:yes stop_codon:yes gene_type:complete